MGSGMGEATTCFFRFLKNKRFFFVCFFFFFFFFCCCCCFPYFRLANVPLN